MTIRGEDLQPGYGSAKAWVSHLDMIQHSVASGFSTALILEDDVDWDINIKEQMGLISDNIRNLTSTPDQSPFGHEWEPPQELRGCHLLWGRVRTKHLTSAFNIMVH